MDTITAINQVVKELEDNRVILHGQGYCFAMAEIVQAMLRVKGVESQLVECQLTAIHQNPPKVQLVGHGVTVLNDPREFDTHMVCVTVTDDPYLIDLSLGSNIIVPTKIGENGIIANATTNNGNLTVLYRQKETPSFPPVLNQNVVSRIKSELQLRRSVKWLKTLVIGLLVISTLNAIRGMYEAYEVWVVDDNYWGPWAVQELNQKIDHINQQLEPENLKKRLDSAGVRVQPK